MAQREDPLVGFHFAVDMGGVIAGYFTECSGEFSPSFVTPTAFLKRALVPKPLF